MTKKYMVLRDTKEKEGYGWEWRPSKYCEGTQSIAMETGDYTLRGLENYFVIERKGGIAEWAMNIHQERFFRELERLQEFKFSWILLEFNMKDIFNYPVGSGIPRHKWKKLRFRGPYILKVTTEMMVKYNTKFILCGNSGKEVASNIFKRMIEHVEQSD